MPELTALSPDAHFTESLKDGSLSMLMETAKFAFTVTTAIIFCIFGVTMVPVLAQTPSPQDQLSIPPLVQPVQPPDAPADSQSSPVPPPLSPGEQQQSSSPVMPAPVVPLVPTAPLPPQPPASASDFTEKLVLRKGLRISFPITNGLDTRWHLVGNYNFICNIEYNDNRGYRFDWQMTHPASIAGLRAVEAEDRKDAYKVSFFYPANESQSLIGFTSIVRISDHLYQQLKTGQVTRFELDGPESPLVYKREVKPLPHEIVAEGYENVTVIIDGMRLPVRAIRAKTDAGWTYWILDNPNFPIMLQGSGPFQWKELKFDYADGLFRRSPIGKGGGAGGDLNKAKREANNLIKQLKSKGQATSYLILFDFDSDKLKPLSKQILDELSKYLISSPDIRLSVEGHTCTIGGKSYNLNLSDRRAHSVKKYLVECGVSEERMKPIGYGFAKPVASNKTSKGRARNRRVVFTELK